MSTMPKRVTFREDGPREGFQAIAEVVPTPKKLELIHALAETGVTSIEVTSFVRPDRVPQLADADELCRQLIKKPGVDFHALTLNEKGFLRSLQHPSLTPIGFIMIAASEAFLKRNNNRTLDEAIAELPKTIEQFRAAQLPLSRLMISTAFGDALEGKKTSADVLRVVVRALKKLEENGAVPEEVTFADTTGWGNPESVTRLISEFRSTYPAIEVGLHLHDTRATGLPNLYAGLLCGVTRFDTSVAGLGGCPFAPGAAGNVATEDAAFLCQELGIETGLNLERYIECAKLAERIVGHPLPGKLKSGGLLRMVS